MNNFELLKLKENVEHGNYILPFTIYTGDICETFPLVPIHWHNEIEITVVNEGIALYSIDLDNYNVEEGDIIIIKPLSLHSINRINNMDMNWSTMVFSLDMLKSAVADGCLLKYFAPISNDEHELPLIIKKDTKGYDEILATILNIFNCYKLKEVAYELQLKSMLYYLFSIFYKHKLVTISETAVITNTLIYKIKKVLDYIQNNYMKEISIKEAANVCNFSEYYFMRFFKKYTGMTCTSYINLYRLETAASLLTTTCKPIMEIAFEVGFNNVSYFNKLFIEKFKVTPKKFREANKK